MEGLLPTDSWDRLEHQRFRGDGKGASLWRSPVSKEVVEVPKSAGFEKQGFR